MTAVGGAPGGAQVVKFGGSSFAGPDGYGIVADAVERRLRERGRPLVVVVSAGPGETEALRERLHGVDPHPRDETLAGLVTLADTVGAQLLAAALQRRGREAGVLAGHRIGLVSDAVFARARLLRIDPGPVAGALRSHEVVIVPGGQAADGRGRPTWLGKNSSDLSAVALAAAVGADLCEIHSDVDGVYSADPHLVPDARLLPRVSYDAASLLSLHGAKVIHRRAVELARRRGVEIVLRHNRAPFAHGTTVGAAGEPVAAVVAGGRSVALRYGSEELADRAHAAFHAAHIDTVRLPDGPLVVVVGGFVDLEDFHRRRALAAPAFAGVPVTVLHGPTARTHLTADEDAALRLARRLHATIDGPGTRPRALRLAGV
ncbi:aspartate kinase [Streptomyces sp. NPDC091268]|uniref:amino acid kinase family protein n=1 Tax=Streptomyces sp. NPDC091268 TaxID=3365979 RepID=UPI0038044185